MNRPWRQCLAPGFAAALLSTTALGDVITDGSLGPSVRLDGRQVEIDDGLGTRRGANLFHSFERFDIGAHDRVTFLGDGGLDHIIARVTGGFRSDIDGTIASTAANADLWLINPAGILFESRAALDIPGSFHAASASEIRFTDGAIFSAIGTLNGTDGSGLSVAPPSSFGFVGPTPSAIELDGPNFELASDAQLTLAAGDLRITGDGFADTLRIEGGRLVLAATGGPGEIQPSAGAVRGAGRIEIVDGAVIDLSGPAGGQLVLSGGDALIGGESIVDMRNLGILDAGIALSAAIDRFEIQGGVRIEAGTQALGNGGDIVIDAENIAISGGIYEGGLFSTSIYGPASSGSLGDAGSIRISSNELTLGPGGNIGAYGGFFAGNAGSVEVIADNIAFDGANGFLLTGISIGSGEFGGRAGSVKIDAQTLSLKRGATISASNGGYLGGGQIEIDAERIDLGGEAGDRITGLFSSSLGSGQAGSLRVDAGELRLQSGAQIASDAIGIGDAGDITVAADRVELRGGGELDAVTAISSRSTAMATGDAGDIAITANALTIANSARIVTNSRASGNDAAPADGGNAGTIAIDSRTTQLDGNGTFGTTGIFSEVANKPGNAGTISIAGSALDIVDGAQVSSTSIFGGDAGAVEIAVDRLQIDDGKSGLLTGIATSSLLFSGFGGRIDVIGESVEVRGGGTITSTTGADFDAGSVSVQALDIRLDGQDSGLFTGISTTSDIGAFGNAGQIDLKTTNLEIVGGAQISSDTLSFGNGGTVDIDAEIVSIRGGTLSSSISSQAAAGSFGNAGSIQIDTDVLELLDGGIVRSSSFGFGAAGNIDLETARIDFANARVRTEGQSSQGGRIRVTATELISVQDVEITTNGILAEDGASIIQVDAPLLALNRSRIFSLIEGIQLTPQALDLLDEIRSGEANLLGGTSIVSIDTVVAATTNTDVTGVLNDIDSNLQLSEPSLARTRDLLNSACIAQNSEAGSSLIADMPRIGFTDPAAPLRSVSAYELQISACD